MDFEEIRKYQRREKNRAKLLDIGEEFYKELQKLLEEKQKLYKESLDPKIKKDIENIKKIARDLYKKRERKIVSRAIRESEEPDKYNLVDQEEQLFQDFRQSVKKGRKNLEMILESAEKTTKNKDETQLTSTSSQEAKEKQERQEKTQEDAQEPKEQDEDLNKVMVRILKEVPEFVSDNLQKLGPYEEDSVVKMKKKHADLLSEEGLAEEVEEE